MRSFTRWRRRKNDEAPPNAPALDPPTHAAKLATTVTDAPPRRSFSWSWVPWKTDDAGFTTEVITDRAWWLMKSLVLLIIASSFVLGFTALSDIANETEVFPRPWGGPFFAVSVDGFILLGSLAFALAGLRGHARVMIGLGVAASASFQVMHAVFVAGDRVLFSRMTVAVCVALIPPFALLLSVDAWRKIRQRQAEETDRRRKEGLGLVERRVTSGDELADLTQFAHLPPNHVDAIALSDIWSRTDQTDPETRRVWTHQALRRKVKDVYEREVPWQVVKRFIEQQLAVDAASTSNGHHDRDEVVVE